MELSSEKLAYKEFLKENPDIGIFHQDWWLDSLCGSENWDILLVKRDDKIIGALPFYFKKKFFFFRIITQPPLTQFMGPIIKNTASKYNKKIGNQKKVIQELIDQLPKFSYFSQACSSDLTNWLPFYWKGFKQNTLYTYVLDDLSNLEVVWNGFSGSVRTDIRKAKKNHVVIREDADINEFYSLYQSTYKRKKQKAPINIETLLALDKACSEKQCRKILIAEDQDKNILSGAFIIWDSKTAYYLLGGLNESAQRYGSQSYLLWEAIKFSSSKVERFDFEGSMNEQIERFFRAFGAKQQQYFNLSKVESKLLKIAIEILY